MSIYENTLNTTKLKDQIYNQKLDLNRNITHTTESDQQYAKTIKSIIIPTTAGHNVSQSLW